MLCSLILAFFFLAFFFIDFKFCIVMWNPLVYRLLRAVWIRVTLVGRGVKRS